MNTKKFVQFFPKVTAWILLFLVTLLWCPAQSLGATVPSNSSAVYQERTTHSRDGIGKFYQGREIARVMGHQAAGWLERRTREKEEHPSLVIQGLGLKPTDIVADIGAGTGYFAFRISPLVPQGKVFAVDIQPEMVDIMEFLKKEKAINNVETVLATVSDPKLPNESINLALMVDAYHEFSYPKEVMEGIVKALKPAGRVVLIEYRAENPFVMIKPLHKMTQNQVRKELSAVGLKWVETKNFLPQQHFMVFEKGDPNEYRTSIS